MKYRIWTNGEHYKLEKYLGFWKGFTMLDRCDAWCGWYAKEHPMIFSSKKEVEKYIRRDNWRIEKLEEVVKSHNL